MLSRLSYPSKQEVTLRHWKDFGGFTGEKFTISMSRCSSIVLTVNGRVGLVEEDNALL